MIGALPSSSLGHVWRIVIAIMFSVAAQCAMAAEEKATLIADLVEITGANSIRAQGNVEVLHKGSRLLAESLVYDRRSKSLQIKGPLRIDDGKNITILASQADLSDDLRNGLMLGAQMIIDAQLQLTAGALQRVDGNYNTLHQAMASSCKICQGGAPLWEIRAKRVIHDTQEKQLYFDHAQFRLGGVPIAYFPRLRLADPTLERATGFLVPKLEVTSTLGIGLKFPYFIKISGDKDLLVTPFASASGARSLDLRYRQAFRTGSITINGAITRDEVLAGKLRGYVLASGAFNLPKRYKLNLTAETVSDRGYFRGYGLDEQDRFVTSAQVSRASRDTYVKARVLGFYSVRVDENNATQPSQIADFERGQRLNLGALGDAQLTLYGAARQRASTNPADGDDRDTFADGRDVQGIGLRADWRKQVTLPHGILASGAVSLRTDAYRVAEDAEFAGQYNRQSGAIAAQLRWPLIKSSPKGARHTIEPIAQIVLAPDDAKRLFNEDSALVEFDEGNLFSMNRFAGSDRIETGHRANFGLNYSFAGVNGTRGQLALGRVYSASKSVQFAQASGLGQKRSDWLVAGQLDVNTHIGLTLRSLISDQGKLRKIDFRGAAGAKANGVSLGYLFAPADAAEQRDTDISEVSLFTTQRLSSVWKGSFSARYDANARKLSKSQVGLVYRNECLQVDVSLSRNFTSSSTVASNTVFGLSVALLGFGGQTGGAAAQCRG